MESILSPHARVRMQQRGIRPEALEALLDFGRMRYLRKAGCEVVYFDKRARARLARLACLRRARETRVSIWRRRGAATGRSTR